MEIKWNKEIDLNMISFDSLLITCFEGLSEDKHPYNFIAYNCVDQLLKQNNAEEKIKPIEIIRYGK
ncbi:hypothetical protein IMG5_162380 [Ichthyophthirius multifiliis]|uniref:Uncharacterized protein n=1 Tax=Ichthyophthirius multifiliis TaxID=5932 RepID=G0R075_ICHMU|nr:hypothetical protein IMG5_162380 [Ichthyophthirius multifiliis]EGR29135.1 hypothetical protein IMG5_162380 [Ichthyophthirius multifiliis]|eukprot:XP_004030371.1 hypothetical protein IMG5_162380 [Ichthyophthirius multifiliis]